MRKIFSLVVSTLALVSAFATADVKIAVYNLPPLFEPSGNGSYDQLFNKVKVKANENWSYNILPAARAEQAFSAKNVDCVAPFDKDFSGLSDVIQSDFFNVAKIYIFTPAGTPALTKLKQLQGKKVGARRGMPYGPEFGMLNLKVDYVETIEANIKKLKAGRIDAFLAYVPDAWEAFNHLGMKLEDLSYNEASPYITHEDGFLCHNTLAAQAFLMLP
ncbi:hypothetical protein AADZ91_17085 [Colwelliaceae bacterium 6441]